MSDLNTPSILSRDHWVIHPRGRIFARSWAPSHAADAYPPRSPIVLFHDSLGCVELWRDFPAELSAATGRQVIAYDRLGFGKSDPRTERPGLDFVAEEATAWFPVVRDQLGFRRFISLGHSVGGGMGIQCAAAFGEDCEALVTESAQVFAEDRTLRGIAEAREQFKDAAQLGRLERYHGDKARWVLEAWTENWLDPAFASWSLNSVLPRVACPVLAIHGDHDEYGSTRHPEIIGQLCGGLTRVEVMEDTHHVPHRERPGDVLELVAEFLAALA